MAMNAVSPSTTFADVATTSRQDKKMQPLKVTAPAAHKKRIASKRKTQIGAKLYLSRKCMQTEAPYTSDKRIRLKREDLNSHETLVNIKVGRL